MKLNRIFYVLFLSVGLLVACDNIGGQGASGKIAYVDVQQVVRDSKAGKDLTRQIKSYNEKRARRARPEEARLNRERDQISQQRGTLSASALMNKEQNFREKVRRYQQKVQSENKRLQAGADESLAEIEDVLEQIYKEIIDKESIDLLLNKSAILNKNEKFDITEKVVAILNDRIPSIKLAVPKE